jgi:hypothetical protein
VTRGGGDFWTERKVAWYRRALERSDYAHAVLGVLEPLLGECASALDVGAGCGALAVPLARRLRRVTALEPSPAMARALREEARALGLGHLEVVEAPWGAVPLEPHDLVVCAHVGGLSDGASPFLREVGSVARRGVALVRDAGEGGDKFFFAELYPRLLGRPYGRCCDWADTVEGLRRLGIAPRVEMIRYRSDQPFADLEEACDFWQEYLGVTGADVRAFLREFLAARLVREDAGLVALYPKEAAVIWWRTAPAGGRSAALSDMG